MFLLTGINGVFGEEKNQPDDEGMKLKQAWKLEVAKLEVAKPNPFPFKGDLQFSILERLIRKAPANVVETEYRRICHTNIPSIAQNTSDLDSNYDYILLEVLVDRSIDAKDASKFASLGRVDIQG
jgi:hypothetical protein